MIRAVIFICCLGLMACTDIPRTTRGAVEPLQFKAAELARAQKIAVFIPGALSSIDVFTETDAWEDAGYARVYYRYPGLDGMPLDHRIDQAAAASHIADFLSHYPGRDIALVGYSTGGPIALMAADRIEGAGSIRVAALSTGVDYAGGLATLLRGGGDVIRAVVQAGSLERMDVWKEFWAGLLYGRDAFRDPAFEDRLDEKIAEGEKIVVELNREIALTHTLNLPTWRLPPDLNLDGVPVAFFIGLRDPVFATWQTQAFARQVGDVTIYGYPDEGHLIFFTRPAVFDDILAWVEGAEPRSR